MKNLLIVILSLFLLNGCATIGKERYLKANTPKEQKLMDIETEIRFGHYVDAYIQNEYMVLDNPELQQKLEYVFNEIVANCDRNDLNFKLQILNSNDVNAFAGPGGYVYITTGLLDIIKNKDEFAGVMAHEIGHICARHIIKRFYGTETTKGLLTIFSILAAVGSAATTGDTSTGQAASDLATIVAVISIQGYSRQDELQADSLAVKYTKRRGYNPLATVDLLKRMVELREKETGEKTVYTLLSSHPPVENREENIKKQIEVLEQGGLK